MKTLFLVLVAAFSFLTPLPAAAVLPGTNPGSGGPGTGPGPIHPALTAGTSLDVSHDLGDHGPVGQLDTEVAPWNLAPFDPKIAVL